jgi:toxin HigB-1
LTSTVDDSTIKMMIRTVKFTSLAKKDLKELPSHIARKLLAWVDDVESEGLEEVRKRPGYHDEPLKGDRKGQRSIRLSKGYRVIYEVINGEVKFVQILEVNKHVY